MTKAQLAQVPHDVLEAPRDALAPAVHLDLPVTRGDVGHDAVAEALGNHLGKRRLAHEHRPQRDAPHAEGAQPVDARERAHAAAGVHGEALDLADGLDGGVVGGARGLVLLERGGKVDDVHPRGTLPGEVVGDGRRVLRVDLHLGAVATLEADDLAAHEVDGWKQDHFSLPFTIETKFLRIASPVAELFSGWNWHPNTLPFQATHGKLRT